MILQDKHSVSSGLSIVIPVYRSETTILPLVDRILSVTTHIKNNCEIILVNDGSPDNSWNAITIMAKKHSEVRGIDLMRNYGQHNALLVGIRAARYAIIATLDDDLQNPPEALMDMIKKLEEGFDVVYGTPNVEQHGFFRDAASRITKIALQSAMGAKNARSVSAFRVFRTTVRDSFKHYNSSFVSIDVLLTWGTTRFTSISVKHDRRLVGTSNYDVYKLINHAINMITGFSTVPLQIASILGFALTLFGIGIFIFVIGRYFLIGGSIPGFPFLASIIAIFSGAQMFSLGIIGEYLARMHFRSMGKPFAAIRQEISSFSNEHE